MFNYDILNSVHLMGGKFLYPTLPNRGGLDFGRIIRPESVHSKLHAGIIRLHNTIMQWGST